MARKANAIMMIQIVKNTYKIYLMSTELIRTAISKGAKLYASVSGGKDGDAMMESLVSNNFPVTAMVHADLGRVEWKESMPQIMKAVDKFKIPVVVVKRKDGLDLLGYWQRRMEMLKGSGKPFWSSSKARYCTSDLKRAPINVYFTSTQESFVISCEGIRGDESKARAKKKQLTIRSNSSEFYKGMTVEEAIAKFNPKYKLFLTWFPIFNYTLAEVWATKLESESTLRAAQEFYKRHNKVPIWWNFHPAYVYGNKRVSCMFCVLGCLSDLQVGAKHNPELLTVMIEMEVEGSATFKSGWSLKELLPAA